MRHKKIIATVVLSLFILGVSIPTLGAAPPISEMVSDLDFDIKNIEHNVEPYLPESKTDEKRDIDFNLFRLEKITSITPDKYYGRQALSKSANKDVRLYVYDAIVECISNNSTKASFEDGPYEVYIRDYNAAIHAVNYDYPQYFYYNSYADRYEYSGERCMSASISYYDFEDLDAAKIEFEETADSIINNAGITASMSDYEKAKRLHDVLIGWVEYNYEAAETSSKDSLTHTAYSAIVNHSAVCDGYAKAYQYLLYKVGVLSHIVTGYGQSDSAPENHAWNIVWLDNNPYYVDVTWDDTTLKGSDEGYISAGISYRYFNMDDEMLKKDHTINKNIIYDSKKKLYDEEDYSLEYDLPVCSSLDENYYKKEGVWLTSENQNSDEIIDKIATMLATDVKARVYVDDEVDFNMWFKNNGKAILDKYRKITLCNNVLNAGYITCDNEYGLTFIESDTMKVNENYEVVIYYDGSDSGKLCQMIYDENGTGSYFNLINVEASPTIIRLMMYPWKKNLKCDTAKYMYLNFDSGYKPIIDKFVLEY